MFWLTGHALLAQTFTPAVGITFPGVSSSALAWGDYDNDGRLDVVLSGTDSNTDYLFRLYRQKSDGSGFEDKTTLLPGIPNMTNCSIAWGDYDNDGRLDLIVTGFTTKYYSYTGLFHQKSDGSGFENKTVLLPSVPTLSAGTTSWIDYDNDGKLDLFLSGKTNGSTVPIRLYRQKRDGSGFEDKSALLNNLKLGSSSVAWGDYNNDGLLDLLLTGTTDDTYSGRITRLYRQKTVGGFEDVSGLIESGIGVVDGSVAWGDYDNDGRLDFLLTGGTNSASSVSRLYHQKADGTGFENRSSIVENFINVQISSVAWGDYDNDGKPDFLLTGYTNTSGAGPFTRLYHQKSDGSGFEDVTGTALPGVSQVEDGTVAWADYDGDDRLDFLLVGLTRSAGTYPRIAQLYHNNVAQVNTSPQPPASLQSQVNAADSSITFSWIKAVDAQTPSNGLTYTLYVGDQVANQTIVNAMADQTTGSRRVVMSGASQLTTYKLNGVLPGKTYYWSVQSVDATFKGSTFSTQQSVTVAGCTQITTLKNGFWNDTSVWSCGRIPTQRDVVIIQHTIDIPAAYTANALKISYTAGQSIRMNSTGKLYIGTN